MTTTYMPEQGLSYLVVFMGVGRGWGAEALAPWILKFCFFLFSFYGKMFFVNFEWLT